MIAALRWLVGVGQAAVELVGAGRRLVRDARRGVLRLEDTDPIPLSHRDVEHIEGQIRQATEQRPEIRPPPRKSSRYD